MIPYIELHQFIVFGITLYAWGILVSLGFFVGLLVAKMHAKKHGLDDKKMIDLAFWILLASIIGGRIGHIPYAFEWYLKEPLNIFRMWDGGMSVFGGFIGALFATVIFLKIKKLPFWGYASSAIFGLPFGLWIGRIGCFLIHDHPGLQTSFFLGVKYPDGIIRHDHGLYLSLNGLFLALIFLAMERYKVDPKWYIAIFCLEYGLLRVFLDFLRDGEVRYLLNLAPSQILAIPMMVVGGGIIIHLIKNYGKSK